ncbi:MAG: PepSY domain-containing protein, partial [Gammaproteobacteria bacterium]
VCVLLSVGHMSPVLAEAPDKPAVSLDDAVQLVRKKSGGRVLRAETKRRGERAVHEIRVLTEDGKVRTFVVDRRTGKVR